ncbi:MAG: peptidylprolyl isomerase [Muribaculum sp.]|nr:peptidylprolyl isomerase [Muribaculaceae bacterium]MCM1080300.1 peptidylprolyl isomerase [Muribaculum sp.]
MIKRFALFAVAAATMLTAGAKKPSDPVLLIIDNEPVTVSEFKYLYNKNNAQQADSMTPEKYLDLFVNYKLKVADAKEHGIDTTAAFKKEFDKYKFDLFKPYLENREELDRLIMAEYERLPYEVNVNHIMFYKGRTPEEQQKTKHFADSIRNEIVNGADFAEMARKYSFDKETSEKGGNLGYMTAGRVPYQFDEVAFSLPIGQISEVFECPYTYHIIRVDDKRATRGQVLARHILKLTRDKSPEEQAAAKVAIDSIYKALKGGADFDAAARKESEDPGSAQNGGLLPWFSPGQMVAEFENTAFALADSAISEPIKTSYGYHIIQRLGKRDKAPYEEAAKSIIMRISRDDRRNIPREKKLEQLTAQYGVEKYQNNIDGLIKAIDNAGQLDTTLVQIFTQYSAPFAKVANNPQISSADVLERVRFFEPLPAADAKAAVEKALTAIINEQLSSLEIARMEAVDPEFRNVVREYHDGMMLFEIANQRVWEAATNDQENLQKFFLANKDKYKFDQPRFKGIIVYTTSDSLARAAEEYTKTHKIGLDSLGRVLRREIGKTIRVEKVLAKEGDNPRIDTSVWGKPYRSAGKAGWHNWYIYEGKLIDAPEEVSDVRAQVITDYQQELENKWIDELKAKHKIKINKGRLKDIR